MIILVVFTQLFVSVIVNVYVPAVSPVAADVVCGGMVFHKYFRVPVPPEALAFAVPLLPPLQLTFVPVADMAITGGSPSVKFENKTQLFESVIERM